VIFTTELVTSILRLNALICFLCNYFSVLTIKKKNRKKKEELSLLSESNSPKVCSFHATSSLTSSSMKKYNDDKEKSEKKKGRNSPARVKTPPYSNPLRPFFPAGVFSFICHFHNACFVHLQEKKQTMKKRAPTLPPSIIDR